MAHLNTPTSLAADLQRLGQIMRNLELPYPQEWDGPADYSEPFGEITEEERAWEEAYWNDRREHDAAVDAQIQAWLNDQDEAEEDERLVH
jgi:hypothetical protein